MASANMVSTERVDHSRSGAETLPEELVDESMGYRGIGGGENLLLQWYVQDLRRYLDLVDKITTIPPDLLEHLIACCVRDRNRMGLALLLAVARIARAIAPDNRE